MKAGGDEALDRLDEAMEVYGRVFDENCTYKVVPYKGIERMLETLKKQGIRLAVLSNKHQPLFNYFKQLFAQVTNPPIDSIREKVVTSTTVYIGEDGNLLEEKAINCQVLKVDNPILTNTDLMKIKNMKVEGFKVVVLPTTYYKNTSLEKALDHLFVEADRAYRDGANILILSDRGIDENHVAIPSLLAVSGLQQHLVKTCLLYTSPSPRDS